MKPDTRLHLAHHVGQRVQKSADKLFQKIKHRSKMGSRKPRIASDGNRQYPKAILKFYSPQSINYGQLIKIRKEGRVIGKRRKNIFGRQRLKNLETVFVERYSNTLRHRISRLTRKTLCFSKSSRMLDNHLAIWQVYNNFFKTYDALSNGRGSGSTPAMAEKIVDHIWDWTELFAYKSIQGLSTTN